MTEKQNNEDTQNKKENKETQNKAGETPDASTNGENKQRISSFFKWISGVGVILLFIYQIINYFCKYIDLWKTFLILFIAIIILRAGYLWLDKIKKYLKTLMVTLFFIILIFVLYWLGGLWSAILGFVLSLLFGIGYFIESSKNRGSVKEILPYFILILQFFLLFLFLLVLFNKVPGLNIDNLNDRYHFSFYIYAVSIIASLISKPLLFSGSKQENIDYKERLKLLVLTYYYRYFINLLVFLLLTFIFIYFILHRILESNINSIGLILVFGLLISFFSGFIEIRESSIIEEKKLNYVLSSFFIPLLLSVFILFGSFIDNFFSSSRINRFLITTNYIIYGDGQKLGYITTNAKVNKDIYCKYKVNDSISNKSFFSLSGVNLFINNKNFCEIRGSGYNSTITGEIYLFSNNKSFISLRKNVLNGEIDGISLNNITGSIQDLKEVYNYTLNSNYISIIETGRLIFNSILTLFLFSLVIVFWKNYKKEYNNYKILRNKLDKINILLSSSTMINKSIDGKIVDKILENPEDLLPLIPIDDNKLDVENDILEKIKNLIETYIKNQIKKS